MTVILPAQYWCRPSILASLVFIISNRITFGDYIMRVRFFALALLGTLPTSAVAQGTFSDTVKFTQPGCEKTGWCTLAQKFGFVDSTGRGWEAAAGDITNGASIPPKLQPYFGGPFDPDLIRAAIIHDHYCDRRVRDWYNTHWVFYDALLASGVTKKRAAIMLAGVLAGGPKWIWLTRGKPCTTGLNCLQQVPTASLPFGGTIQNTLEAKTLLYRPARYASPDFLIEMAELEKQVDALGDNPDPKAILSLVKKLRPADPFIHGPDEILLPGSPRGGIDK